MVLKAPVGLKQVLNLITLKLHILIHMYVSLYNVTSHSLMVMLLQQSAFICTDNCNQLPLCCSKRNITLYLWPCRLTASVCHFQDVLMQCWAYSSDDRPDFRGLLKLLDRLPKKRLARSPSHPIQLSRSAESVF